MKKLHKTSIFLVVIIILCSCDFLNEPQPKGALTIRNLNTLSEYKAVLIGAYDGVQSNAFELIYFNDVMCGFQTSKVSLEALRQITFQSVIPINSTITSLWNDLYRAINYVNIVIDGINKVEGATQSEIENLLGQAYFLRAIIYHYLVRYYALPWGATPDNSQLGIPLLLDPIKSTNDFVPVERASVKEVYDQIIKDLKKAASLEITNKSPGLATNNAVTALRARLALIQERWEDAAKFTGEVIPHYQLSPSVTDYFRNELGPEAIFSLVITPTDVPPGGGATLTGLYNINGRSGSIISDKYKTALGKIVPPQQEAALKAQGLSAVDTRVTKLLYSTAEPPLILDDYTHVNKYENFTTSADNGPVLRLSEMILIRAEALAELNGVNKESVALLNKIRTRAIKLINTSGATVADESLIKYTTGDFQTREELIETIFLERGVELAFEGHRKTDIRRKELTCRGTPWDANKLVFPIPQSQIDASEIQQNPGY